MVLVKPIAISYGMILIRAENFMKTAPADAWKKVLRILRGRGRNARCSRSDEPKTAVYGCHPLKDQPHTAVFLFGAFVPRAGSVLSRKSF